MINLNKVLTQDCSMTCLDPNGNPVIYKSYQQWEWAIIRLNTFRGVWEIQRVGALEKLTPEWDRLSNGRMKSIYALSQFKAN